jgi:hypothetical protein
MVPLPVFNMLYNVKPRTISLQDALKKLSEVKMKKSYVPLQTLSKFFPFYEDSSSTELTVCSKSVSFRIKVLFPRCIMVPIIRSDLGCGAEIYLVPEYV